MKKYILLVSLFFLIFSCGEEIPEYAEIINVDINTQKVSYKKVKLKGVVSLENFESERFKYLSFAKISLFLPPGTQIDENTATIKEINDVTYQEKGVSPNIRYTIQDNTLIPYTLNDQILVTLHYNLRNAFDFFKSLGLNPESGANGKPYGQIKVFYRLKFEIPNENNLKDTIKDNAMYYPLLNSLAFFEQKQLKHLALVVNPMVVTHEFAHSIFAYLAEGILDENTVFMDLVPKNCDDIHQDFYKSAMNEGFSDYWAAVKEGSTDLFYLSVTKHEIQADKDPVFDRSLENNKILTSNMLVTSRDEEKCQNETKEKSYYWAGTVWASSLWEIRKTLGIENFDKLVLKSYLCLYSEFNLNKSNITPALPGNCLVKTLKENNLSSEKINKVCSVLKKRFSIIQGEFNECN